MEESSFENISLSTLPIPSILTESDTIEFAKAVNGLLEVKSFLNKIEAIRQTAKLPTQLLKNFDDIKNNFVSIYDSMAKDYSKLDSVRAVSEIKRAYNRAIDYKNGFFEVSSSNYPLFTCTFINALSGANAEEVMTQSFSLMEDLEKEVKKANTLNKELEDKAAKSVVSNYAEVFSNQEKVHKKNANKW